MRRIALLALSLVVLVPLLVSAPAHAQATRTWVSGVGDDANPCSRTAPCKTFAGAISKTAAAGEINCLDPGGFGAITITKAVTLNCSATLGSILVAGTNAVTINAASTDKVVLRNVQLQGLQGSGVPGLVGVKIISAGVVSIENCVVTQFSQQGILDSRTGGGTQLFIRNTVISLNAGNGVSILGAATNNADIEESSIINNGANGIGATTGNNTVVKRSTISGNTGIGLVTDANGVINVDDSVVSNNGTAAVAAGPIRLSNTDVSFNTNGGNFTSYGNNRLLGNGSTPAITSASQQ